MEKQGIKKQNKPLLSWDIYYNFYQRIMTKMNDKDYLEKFIEQKVCNFPKEVMKSLNEHDAVVITDKDQNISWVSSGFYTMTGYTPKEAVDKKPSFLQGAKTDLTIKNKIKEAVLKRIPVTDTIVNYKKSGIEYKCRVQIEPVFNTNREITHFIAFEKEVA